MTSGGTTTFSKTVVKTTIRNTKLSAIKDQVYTGKTIKPRVTVKYANRTLRNGTDYTVSY